MAEKDKFKPDTLYNVKLIYIQVIIRINTCLKQSRYVTKQSNS
jgi:hypothetical protein